MPSGLLRLIIASALLTSGAAAASAADRCEGTLCDLYYQHMPAPQPAAPAQPATAAAAGQPAAPRKLVAVQGGGLIGMMNGTAPKRCTGTLCDLMYGGPPPEEPAATPTEAAVTPEPASDEAPVTSRRSQIEAPTEAETRPDCVADARDPWRCYRH